MGADGWDVTVAQTAFEALAELLNEPVSHPPTTKLVIQCFTGLYPVLFRWLYVSSPFLPPPPLLSSIPPVLSLNYEIHILTTLLSCSNRNARPQWDALNACKARILDMVWAPHTPAGVRLAALKFAQRVVLVQTKGASDPRVSVCYFGCIGLFGLVVWCSCWSCWSRDISSREICLMN
jgi:symplekin